MYYIRRLVNKMFYYQNTFLLISYFFKQVLCILAFHCMHDLNMITELNENSFSLMIL